MWPKQHISSTMEEMDSLDHISLDAAGAISTSWRLVHKILPPWHCDRWEMVPPQDARRRRKKKKKPSKTKAGLGAKLMALDFYIMKITGVCGTCQEKRKSVREWGVKGMKLGDGRSLPAGNYSSKKAAHRDRDRAQSWSGTNSVGKKKRCVGCRAWVPRRRKACIPGEFKPNPSQDPFYFCSKQSRVMC